MRRCLFRFPRRPKPPKILRRVSEALATADDAEKQLDAEAGDAARVKQSILKAAFEGRLVPQDTNDEPASARWRSSAAIIRSAPNDGGAVVGTARLRRCDIRDTIYRTEG